MLEILYQDEYCVAVNKPAGMLVHRSWLDKGETQFVMQTLRDQIGRHVYPVHRLDRPTSGVLLFALDAQTAHQLSLQFENHQVHKTYWAVVRGYVLDDKGGFGEGVIDYALKPRWDKIADKFAKQDKAAQDAISRYRTLAIAQMPFATQAKFDTSRYAWVELTPITGRKHQLRRHMTHIFHPIVGDTTYGDTAQNRAVAQHTGSTRLLLHAYRLGFCHPVDGRQMSVVAGLDDDFVNVMNAFGWGGQYDAIRLGEMDG